VKMKKWFWTAYVPLFSVGYTRALLGLIIPHVQKDWMLDFDSIALILSGSSLTTIVVTLPSGIAVDWWGSRVVQLLSALCVILSALLGYFADSFGFLFVSSIFLGLFQRNMTVAVNAKLSTLQWKAKSKLLQYVHSGSILGGLFITLFFLPIFG